MIEFLARYHSWACRATNGKQFSAVEHCVHGVTSVVFLAAAIGLPILAIKALSS